MVRSHCTSTAPTNFSELSVEMEEAHHALLGCMEEVEALTQRRNFADTDFRSARLRISQASFRRRSQFQRVCRALQTVVSDGESHSLRRLSTADAELLKHSSAHVSRWTAAEVERNWEGYCAASRKIRHHMMTNLRAERAELFPILQRMARSASAASRSAVGAANGKAA